MDSFLYVTCMNESFNKHIQPKTEQALKETEADDLLLKGRVPSSSWFFPRWSMRIELKDELEQRYAALEELYQSGKKYDQQDLTKNRMP